MLSALRVFLQLYLDRRAMAAIEYTLLAALVAVVVINAVSAVEHNPAAGLTSAP